MPDSIFLALLCWSPKKGRRSMGTPQSKDLAKMKMYLFLMNQNRTHSAMELNPAWLTKTLVLLSHSSSDWFIQGSIFSSRVPTRRLRRSSTSFFSPLTLHNTATSFGSNAIESAIHKSSDCGGKTIVPTLTTTRLAPKLSFLVWKTSLVSLYPMCRTWGVFAWIGESPCTLVRITTLQADNI